MKKLKGKLHKGEQHSGSGNSWKELTLVFSHVFSGNARGIFINPLVDPILIQVG